MLECTQVTIIDVADITTKMAAAPRRRASRRCLFRSRVTRCRGRRGRARRRPFLRAPRRFRRFRRRRRPLQVSVYVIVDVVWCPARAMMVAIQDRSAADIIAGAHMDCPSVPVVAVSTVEAAMNISAMMVKACSQLPRELGSCRCCSCCCCSRCCRCRCARRWSLASIRTRFSFVRSRRRGFGPRCFSRCVF